MKEIDWRLHEGPIENVAAILTADFFAECGRWSEIPADHIWIWRDEVQRQRNLKRIDEWRAKKAEACRV